MALIVADCVMETTTTTGVGPVALAGPMVGFRAFHQVCVVADTVLYAIAAINGNGQRTGAWETGLGTYSADNQLTRTTVIASSNANAAVDFGVGTKAVYITVPASEQVRRAEIAQLDAEKADLGGASGQNFAVNDLTAAGIASVTRLLAGAGASAAIITAYSTGEYSLGLAGATKALRVIHSPAGTAIEGVDPTLSASYQPLGLNGSELTFSIAGAPVMTVPAAGTGVGVTGAISATTRFNLPSFTVATLPAAGAAAGLIYVSDETGGSTPAFSDSTNWRRVSDRAIVS